MTGVFLSYRRADSATTVERIYDRLVGRFGHDKVYRDVDDIPLGVDFVADITSALTEAAYVLVAVGPRWLTLQADDGTPRLDDPQDPVRFEVRTALDLDRLVVPVLVQGTPMPAKGDLPRDISKMVSRNGIAIRDEPYFDADVSDLMNGLSLEGLDRQRVPAPFDVGSVARNLGFGAAISWGIISLLFRAPHGADF